MYTFEDKVMIDQIVARDLHRQNERRGLVTRTRSISSIDEALALVEQARSILVNVQENSNETFVEDESSMSLTSMKQPRKSRMF